jgi:integrase/recombinase XerD
VFVNLWEGEIGRPLSYAAVDKLVRRTRRRVGFHFTVHMLRHTYATLAYRDGVALEVIGTVLTHRSPHSALVYMHPTAADLRRALEERGVLERVADLVA